MITRLRSEAAPWGGAVLLSLQAPAGTSVLILATPDNAAPDPAAPGAARVVHDGPLQTPSSDWTLTHLDLPDKLPWWMVPDLATEALRDNVTIHYHAYERDGTDYKPPISVAATPNCYRTSQRALARDLVKKRLEYHLARGLRENLIPPVNQRYVPVEEREALSDGEPIPIVLVKERVVPAPAGETIGHNRRGVSSDGRYREWNRQVRSVVEILLVTETPGMRTAIGSYLHRVLEQDGPYWQHAGLQGVTVQTADRHEPGPDRDYFLTELTFECEGELVIREELRVSVNDELDVLGCGRAP